MRRTRTDSTRAMWTIALALLAGAAVAFALAVPGQASEERVTSADAPPEEKGDPGPQDLVLNGTVHDEDGAGLADVDVHVMNRWVDDSGEEDDRGRYIQTVKADENGDFEAQVSEGEVEIMVDEDGYKQLIASLDVESNRTVDLPMRADDDVAQLEVTVQVDGEPLDARVIASSDERGSSTSAERSVRESGEGSEEGLRLEYRSSARSHAYESTGEDGTVTLELEPGTYEVAARADGHIREEVTVEVENETAVELSPIPVPDATLTVRGTVLDAETGEPVPHASVNVVNDRWGERQHVPADEDGVYEVQVPPGPVLVEAEADRSYVVECERAPGDAEPAYDDRCRAERATGYLPRVAPANGTAGEQVTVDLELPRAPAHDATLSGWVINETSEEGIPNATVTVRNEGTGERGHATTDEDGSFRIEVPAGYYTVRAHHPEHPAAAANAEVGAGEEARVVLEAPPGPAHRDRPHVMPHPQHEGATAEDAAGGDGEAREADTAAGARAPDETTYEGSGGGLGAYTAGEDGESRAPAPGPGVLATVAAAGLGALALGARLGSRP